ncbi:PREDICTED: uncharacterized protein LOC104608320 [Nelumbo nucifera]|uniref:Uncharacterized protein LOC104608320 n=1 Tax=Nelumbo nucifera TaxID=4432 RepID=A0A1U8AX04_NELNU|nr:PREDICTED: uncharacterized protein LOC104608320 [Nelumbo nucifera]
MAENQGDSPRLDQVINGENRDLSKDLNNGDPLYLQSFDHPRMILVSTPLTGNNFLTWSKSMMIALEAKVKLGFIDGSCEKLEKESPLYKQWNRVNCMVISWILNSMSKEIAEAFLYSGSAKELWDESQERYGERNGPMLYQLQREISTISQNNMFVAQYYTRLKRFWDELNCLQPIPHCECGAARLMSDITESNRLMQFLMGLNDSFDNAKD